VVKLLDLTSSVIQQTARLQKDFVNPFIKDAEDADMGKLENTRMDIKG
jgi:hypothetical protein